MKNSLGRWLILTASLAGILIAGCSRKTDTSSAETSAPKQVKIGFLVKQPEEPWFQLEWKFAGQAAHDLGFTLIKIGATDGERVLAAIDNLAAGGAQGFVICTPDTRLGPAIAAKAKATGLKFFSFDDQFIGAGGQPMATVHYLGISARKIGEKGGETLAAELKKRGWTMADTAVCAVTFDELATASERTSAVSAPLLAVYAATSCWVESDWTDETITMAECSCSRRWGSAARVAR